MPNGGAMTISYRRGALTMRGGRSEPGTSAMPTLVKLLADSALHRAIFDACAIPIFLVDMRAADRPLVLANPAFEATFGIPVKAAQGSPVAEVLFAGRQESVRHLLGAAVSRIPVTVTRHNGVQIACEATAGMVRSANAEIQYAVVALSARTDMPDPKLETAVAALTCAAAA